MSAVVAKVGPTRFPLSSPTLCPSPLISTLPLPSTQSTTGSIAAVTAGDLPLAVALLSCAGPALVSSVILFADAAKCVFGGVFDDPLGSYSVTSGFAVVVHIGTLPLQLLDKVRGPSRAPWRVGQPRKRVRKLCD